MALKKKESEDVTSRVVASKKAKVKRNLKNKVHGESLKSKLLENTHDSNYELIILSNGNDINYNEFPDDQFIFPIGFKSLRNYYKFDQDDNQIAEKEKVWYVFNIISTEDERPIVSFIFMRYF